MDDTKYRVIFKGDIAERADPDEVRKKIASLLHQEIPETEKLFSGKKYIVRTSSEDLETCKKAQERFRNIGAICFIEEVKKENPSERTAELKTPRSVCDDLEAAYLFADLEIDADETIYQIGYSASHLPDADVFKENLIQVYQEFVRLKQQGVSVCGHNFRRFDYPYLLREHPDLNGWQVIDTLELSLLAFPLLPSHKLSKEYKPSDYAKNNPLEDARATRSLLHKITEAIYELPLPLQRVYARLLSCGTEAADEAYRTFFRILGIKEEKPLQIEEFPEEAIQNFDRDYLKGFWENLLEKDFDTRLSVAALMAWNYQRHKTSSDNIFSGWLAHLPGFWQILESLTALPSPKDYLERFGVKKFRPLQEGAIQAILDRQSPLIIMPTGSGKSLCYQIPALMLFEKQKSLTLVISPLQALMADQVADLEAKGIYFSTLR